MSTYEPMPMSIDDLENFNQLFHMTIGGIEEHLTGDQLDKHYVISTLLALGRQLDRISYDVGIEVRRAAHEAAVMKFGAVESARKEEGLA